MKIEMFEPREVTVEFVVGEQGEQGPPTNIEIGDVETLPPGAEAYLRMRGTAPT